MCLRFCLSKVVSAPSGGTRPEIESRRISAQDFRGSIGSHGVAPVANRKLCRSTIHSDCAAGRHATPITMSPNLPVPDSNVMILPGAAPGLDSARALPPVLEPWLNLFADLRPVSVCCPHLQAMSDNCDLSHSSACNYSAILILRPTLNLKGNHLRGAASCSVIQVGFAALASSAPPEVTER